MRKRVCICSSCPRLDRSGASSRSGGRALDAPEYSLLGDHLGACPVGRGGRPLYMRLAYSYVTDCLKRWCVYISTNVSMQSTKECVQSMQCIDKLYDVKLCKWRGLEEWDERR